LPGPYRSAFSMAPATSGESGVTLGSKRATTLPLLSTRNLVKFHWTSPPVAGFACFVGQVLVERALVLALYRDLGVHGKVHVVLGAGKRS